MSFDRSPLSGTPRSLPPPPAAASGQRNRSPYANTNASFNNSLDMGDSFHNPYATRAPVSPTRMSPQRSDPFLSSHASPAAAASPSRRSLFQSQDSLLNQSSAINMSSSGYGDGARPLPVSPVRLFEPALASQDPFDDSRSVRTSSTSETMAAAQPTLFKSEANSSYDPADCGFNDDDEDYDGHSIFDQQTLSSGSDELPPATQPRRNKCFARKEVKLVRGNLVLDCPVPTKLYSFLPRRDADEFVYMRYSAVTSSPENFADSGFTIRPAIYDRHTELCVCITMYNEDEVLFTRTLHAVFKNIAYLCQRRKSKVWGPDSWKRIVVTVVSDGRSKINPRVLDCLAAMGVFQDGVAKNYVNGEEVHAHLFEYTAQVSLTPDLKFQGAEKQMVPVQMIFCLKERNAKKINSHRWFFDALCPQIDPNVVVLLDVGTRPATQTLYHLWKAFDEDSNVGGACGEIKAMTGRFGKSLLNPLVAAQNFEYKMSNILDKPFESAFGYITVLPGALSAYRWRALQNNPDGTGPLASYFKGETLESSPDATIFEKNMYLAEDRILCWELVSKQNESWVLKYVKAAKGETDVPESLAEFISQRRRWLNGSLFASVYAQTHFRQIWRTSHSPVRKFFLHFEFLYHFLQLLFTFFSMANFYLAFYFVAGSVASDNAAAIPNGGGTALFLIFKYLLVCTICAQFVLSLGNRPQGSKTLFTTSVVVFGCVTAYISAISFYFVARTFMTSNDSTTTLKTLLTMVVSLASTYGVYLVMSLLYFDPWHIFTSALQYFLLLPAYICTLQIYAFCNTHDVTWGTKGDNEPRSDLGSAVVKPNLSGSQVAEVDMPSDQVDIDTGYDNALHSLRDGQPVPPAPVNMSVLQTDYLREFRTRVVLVWMVCNLLLVMLVTQFVSLDKPADNIYLQIILWSMAVFAVVRSAGSLVYLAQLAVRNIHKTHIFASEVCSNVVSKVKNEPVSSKI